MQPLEEGLARPGEALPLRQHPGLPLRGEFDMSGNDVHVSHLIS